MERSTGKGTGDADSTSPRRSKAESCMKLSRSDERRGAGLSANSEELNKDGVPRTAEDSLEASTIAGRTQASSHIFKFMTGTKAEIPNPCTPTPPVTKKSLSELDTARIVQNPKLRHDVNFDSDLHFRPNFDGLKGLQKKRQSEEYWRCMRMELIDAMLPARLDFLPGYVPPTPVELISSPVNKCELKLLGELLQTVREILETLLPDQDHAAVRANLDVPWIILQLRKRCYDFTALSAWLGRLIKTHCAPMRDHSADSMVTQLTEGVSNRTIGQIVDGLKSLFSLLETMKLDVANHQIRTLRPSLIDDYVAFEKGYFLRKISEQKIDVSDAQLWFQQAIGFLYPDNATSKETIFLEALAHTVFVVSDEDHKPFPSTFQFDQERLQKIRKDVYNNLLVEICLMQLSRLLGLIGHPFCPVAPVRLMLRASVLDILEDSSSLACWQRQSPDIAIEILRSAQRIVGRELINDYQLLTELEEALSECFDPSTMAFHHCAANLEQELASLIRKHAEHYFTLSVLSISEKRSRDKPSEEEAHYGEGLDTVAKRLAHIGVLHWKVWATILYDGVFESTSAEASDVEM